MKNQTITITLVIFFTGIVLSGCSFSNMNLADNKKYTVECKKSSDRISIRSVKIYEDDGITVVSGKVKLHKNLPQPRHGHVDIAIISPEGKVMDTASVFYKPRTLTRRMRLKANKSSSFTARFLGPLPQGSIVRLVPHNSIEETADKIDKGFQCGSNLASVSTLKNCCKAYPMFYKPKDIRTVRSVVLLH